VVTLLICVNVAVYLLWNYFGDGDGSFMVQNFLVSWDALAGGRWWTLLTAAFSHVMLFHLLINMFVLRNFGGLLEKVLGHRFTLQFYLVAGVISSLSHAIVSAWLLGSPELPALGASGAVSGFILIFCLLFPKEKILLLGLIPLPAMFGALVFIGLDLWGLAAQRGGGGLPIGHGAHLGGALTGIVWYFWRLRPYREVLRRWVG
jgi:membrane associated rhomboid family serine protease